MLVSRLRVQRMACNVQRDLVMARRLPVICPSNLGGDDGFTLYTTPCEARSCQWWGQQSTGQIGCTAGEGEGADYAKWFTTKRDTNMPLCQSAAQCRWNIDALKRGEPGCFVRRLGVLCEHQIEGGELAVFNTFDMADPDDPVWGMDAVPA